VFEERVNEHFDTLVSQGRGHMPHRNRTRKPHLREGARSTACVAFLGLAYSLACGEERQERDAAPPTVRLNSQQITRSTGAGGAEDPSILKTADGRIWIAWFDRDQAGKCHLWCKNSRDGKTWSDPIQVTRNPEGDNWYPSMIQAADGTLCLAWWSGRTGNGEIWFSESASGKEWSDPIRITNNLGHDWCPSLVQAGDGTLWIAWGASESKGKNKDIWVTRSIDRKQWSQPRGVLHSELSEDFPSLVPYGPKGVRMAYCAYTYRGEEIISLGNDSAEIYLVESEDGSSWSKPIRLTENATVDLLPSLVNEPRGDLSVFWTSSATDPFGDTVGLWMSKGKRSKLYRITSYAGEDYSPKVIRTGEGVYWTAWVSNQSGKRNIWAGSFRSTELK